jgi:hypothetical protein
LGLWPAAGTSVPDWASNPDETSDATAATAIKRSILTIMFGLPFLASAPAS